MTGSNIELVTYFEGGVVYKENRDGKFILSIDQTTLLGMLEEEDREGIAAIIEIEFCSEDSLYEYIKNRGWARGSKNPHSPVGWVE